MVEENLKGVPVTVQAKIPFEMDSRLRDIKKQTGLKIDRLLYLAIKRFLDDIERGEVEAVRILQEENSGVVR